MRKRSNTNREIIMYGLNDCGNCKENRNILKEVKRFNPDFKIKKYDVSKRIGKKAVKEKNLDKVPYTEDCKINPKSGKKECTPVIGVDKNYWSKYIPKKKMT